MDDVINHFKAFKDEVTDNDVAAAILVLALSVQKSAPFNVQNAENFGHELSLALQSAMEQRTLRVEKA